MSGTGAERKKHLTFHEESGKVPEKEVASEMNVEGSVGRRRAFRWREKVQNRTWRCETVTCRGADRFHTGGIRRKFLEEAGMKLAFARVQYEP